MQALHYRTRSLWWLLCFLLLMSSRVQCDDSDNNHLIVTVGKHSYSEPVGQYPESVAQVLRRHLGADAEVYADADWHVQLALAHRSVVEEQIFDMVPIESETSNQHLELAFNAFQQAIQIYQGIMGSQPRWHVEHHLATVYFQMGETYSLNPEKISTANDYLIRAEEIFRNLLEQRQQPRIDPVSKIQVELGWAICCLRLGANWLSGSIIMPQDDELEGMFQQEFIQHQQEGNPIDMEEWLLQHPEQAQQLADAQQKLAQRIDLSKALFEKAAEVLRKAVPRERDSVEKLHLQRHLGTALQNLGTAFVFKGDFSGAVEYLEEALQNHQRVLDSSGGELDTANAMAEALYSLADSYLQLGKYDESTDRYQKSMDVYDKYKLPPAATAEEGLLLGEETLQAYEQALEDYHEMINNPQDNGPMDEVAGETVLYEKDDGYEGDLHTTLGSLYLSAGDHVTAESHLLQSIRLYALSGEQSERSTADTKFNLAAIYFQKGDYLSSAELRRGALDIYRDTVGEGVNPMLDGVPSLDLSAFETKARGSQSEEVTQEQGSSVDDKKGAADLSEGQRTTNAEGTYETIISLDDYEDALMNNSIKEEL
jgi:tetratricopeptide (TPR) repeat protein